MPYIGLTGSYRYEDFELGGTFKYSGWVEASDNDEHYDPGKRITYRSKVKDQNYYSVAVNAGYYVTPNAKVYIEGAWNRVTNKKVILHFMITMITLLTTAKMVQA